VKSTLGSVNIPVVCAVVAVNPGDAIVADDDGWWWCRPNGQARPLRPPRRATNEGDKSAKLAAGERQLELELWHGGADAINAAQLTSPAA
jgi:4-hydroxy-4-methyl-2-oxoglutarate aldolase